MLLENDLDEQPVIGGAYSSLRLGVHAEIGSEFATDFFFSFFDIPQQTFSGVPAALRHRWPESGE